MSGIYISTGVFQGRLPTGTVTSGEAMDYGDGLLNRMAEECEALGAGLELSSGVPWHPGLESEILQMIAGRNGRVLLHNYFPPPEHPFVLNLASTNIKTLERSMKHVMAAIDISAQCGAAVYTVHSGFAMNLGAEDLGKPEAQTRIKKVPYATAYGIFLDAVRMLSVYGSDRGVRLLIENNVRTREQAGEECGLLMTEPGEIARFLRELDDSNVGLLLDVGHAKVTAAALGFEPGVYFEELAGWIGALHLSDNDGVRDNNRPFNEDAWFAKYFLGDVPLVIEVYGVGSEGAAEMVQVVKQWVGEGRREIMNDEV
jgi:sugar phosphate isomerase/epimerase